MSASTEKKSLAAAASGKVKTVSTERNEILKDKEILVTDGTEIKVTPPEYMTEEENIFNFKNKNEIARMQEKSVEIYLKKHIERRRKCQQSKTFGMVEVTIGSEEMSQANCIMTLKAEEGILIPPTHPAYVHRDESLQSVNNKESE